MLIGIDANEANVDRKVGVSEFAFELINEFAKLQSKNTEFLTYLKSRKNADLPAESEFFKYTVFGPSKLWTQWRLPIQLYFSLRRPDVFFSPSHYSPRFSPIPTVVSVMDLSYLKFPELFNKSDLYQLKNWTEYSVKKAKAVITISNSSKFDIINLYNKPENSVHVVYPGIKQLVNLDPHVYPMNELNTKYGISKNFLLFVGTLQPRKNLERLIEAFSKVLSKEQNLELVIVGRRGWLYEQILKAPEKHGVSDSVKFLDYVPDEELPLFYKNAICMVWPSLYEGFGLPVLEAMQYDCPVITSNNSSLPEAGGDGALYVNPEDVNDIADKIYKVINSEKLRNEMIEKGRKQVKKFSWEKAAKETLNILQQTVSK